MEVSGYLVDSAAFKAVGTSDPRPAGSIPVHLRFITPGRSPFPMIRRGLWSQFGHRILGDGTRPAHAPVQRAAAALRPGDPTAGSEQQVGSAGGVLVVARHHVRVDLQRDANVGVADALREHLDRYTAAQRSGRVAVPQVVQPDVRQAGVCSELVERLWIRR